MDTMNDCCLDTATALCAIHDAKVHDMQAKIDADKPEPVAEAQLEAALDSLGKLVRHLRKTGGFMKPQAQSWLRGAEAILVECGRSVES
jgi:hypothetical protein